MNSRWQKELAAILGLLIVAGVTYGFLLRPGYVLYSKHSDLVTAHLGQKTVAYRSFQAGRGLPFWKSDQLSGGSALTHPEALYTHPLHALFLFMQPLAAVGGTVWIHFLVAGLSFHVLGGVLGIGILGRLVMAIAGMVNFKLIIAVYAGWMSLISSFVVMPLLMAVMLRLIDRPGLGPALAMAAVGAISLHSGHLQIFYYTVLVLAGYVAVLVVAWLRRGEVRHLGRVAGWTSAGVVLAVPMAAYLLLPLAAEAPLTSRVEANYDFFLNIHSLRTFHLLTFFYPEVLGTPVDNTYDQHELWEDVGYFGLIPLLLVVAGVMVGWGRRHTRFLAIALLASALLTMDSFVLRLLFHYFPGYGLFRNPCRFLFVTSILGIALAGVGADEMVRYLRRQSGGRAWPYAAVAAILALMVGEGLYYAHRYLTTAPYEQVLPTTKYQQFFAKDPSVFRVAPVLRWTINYGWAAPMNLQLITGYDGYNLRHYQQYFLLLQLGLIPSADQSVGARMWTDMQNIKRGDLMDALNVKYLITPAPVKSLPPSYELAARFEDQPLFKFYEGMDRGPIFVYRNRAALDRAFWASDVVPVENESQAIEQIRAPHDLRRTAVVQGAEANETSGEPSAEDSVRVVQAQNGELSLETNSRNRRFLVISEVWHPGWRAQLDNQPVRLFQTDLALMGAWVPAGSHHLELSFRPLWWTTALSLTLAAVGTFMILMIFWCVRFLLHSSRSRVSTAR